MSDRQPQRPSPTPVSQAPERSADQGRLLRELVGESILTMPRRTGHGPEDLTALFDAAGDTDDVPAPDLKPLVLSDAIVDGVDSAEGPRRRPGTVAPVRGEATRRSLPNPAEPRRLSLRAGRRQPGAVNLVSIVIAIAAVLTLVGTVSLAVVQRVSANPADDAMVSLRAREAELQNETAVLTAATTFYDSSLTDAQSFAGQAEAALSSLEGVVDVSALDAARSARATLAGAVASAASFDVPRYERSEVDEGSIASVGRAIDAVRTVRDSVRQRIGEVRRARAAVVNARDALGSAVREVVSLVLSDAERQADDNAAATQPVRTVYDDAVGQLRSADAAGGDAAAELAAYGSALQALRADNARVLALRGGGTSGSGSAPTPTRGYTPQTSLPTTAPPASEAPTPETSESASPDPVVTTEPPADTNPVAP